MFLRRIFLSYQEMAKKAVTRRFFDASLGDVSRCSSSSLYATAALTRPFIARSSPRRSMGVYHKMWAATSNFTERRAFGCEFSYFELVTSCVTVSGLVRAMRL